MSPSISSLPFVHTEEGDPSRALADPHYGPGSPSLTTLLETCVLLGDEERVSTLVQKLSSAASLLLTWGPLTCIARHLGGAEQLLGRPDRAYYAGALSLVPNG